ncbi:hypothetical protein [Rubrivivax albus]|uniref:Uncharacterized protein n=1 Tax=Rubrivivax albus TaxID=2499835 RepID=A0A3S2UQ97_9BURK|nr:hypothetical protein [Rubrivivax albus]RVT51671.1 hypothetical protein ENE75_12725 [Rubrivivax albus]
MFPSTLPVGAPELMRISDFRRYLRQQQQMLEHGPSTRLTSLSPSLLQDLLRPGRDGQASDLLEVVAASLRHGRALLLHLGVEQHVIPLTLFPAERLAHSPLTPEQMLNSRLQAFEVLQVEPALLQPPGSRERTLVADAAHYGPLGPLTWAIAMRGARDTLLPELTGSAAYRVTPGADLRTLDLPGPLAAAIKRLRREGTNLREMSAWPGFDRERAARLVNALYLQSALIVSRAHPAATNEGWRSHPNVN